MNVNAFLQKDYENEPPSGPEKTNPKQSQFKPNQTQFQKSPNECKLNYNKGLQKKR